MKLSIIIPYYNVKEYTDELLRVLDPQIRDDIEVILIDDGSRIPFTSDYKWLKVFRQANRGSAGAKNAGLDKAQGDYIAFIDADDIVADYYVEKLLQKIDESGADVIDLSWRVMEEGTKNIQILKNDDEWLKNPSACTRAFKRSFIGDARLNEKKDAADDEDFSRRVGYLDPERVPKHSSITELMYFYRTDMNNSQFHRFMRGECKTKRIVYHYRHVTKDMTWLLEEIKKEDELNEVMLYTEQNDIPELKRYCQIIKPHNVWAHIIKGEKTSLLTLREPPIRTQVVVYRRHLTDIGGLMTFIMNFVDTMSEYYDITVLCEDISKARLMQLLPKVRVITGRNPKKIVCDSLIILSFLDHMPQNVKANKVIRMCHACKTDPGWKIPKDYDELLYVSQAAADSFNDPDGKIMHNINVQKAKDTMILVSAIRLPAPDKGNIEQRMRTLADMLNAADIPFIWLNFSSGGIKNPPKHFHNMGVTFDMPSILKIATYSVLLSDCECWPYAALESLMAKTPVICTPFKSAYEMGIKDGVNGYIVPFDMNFDVTKLLDVPVVNYDYDNDVIIKQWRSVLGNTKPRRDYDPGAMVRVKVTHNYYDVVREEDMRKGQETIMTKQRAEHVMEAGYIEIIGGV